MRGNISLFAVFAAIAILITSCSPSTPAPTALPTALPNQLSISNGTPAEGLSVVMVQSVLTIGKNRFAIGLMKGNEFIKQASLMLTFYNLANGKQERYGSLPATYREGPDGYTGIYTADVVFPNAGSWGLAVTGATSDGKAIDQKIGFDVTAVTPQLIVGKKAPAVKTPTLDSVNNDLTKLTSDTAPEAGFYRVSLDAAVSNGKPSIVQFSTPAFCTSRLCGPVYDVLKQMYTSYSDKLNFIHVEVYKDLPHPNLNQPQFADAMRAWGLSTEPWTYILDKNGVVYWRAEGLVTVDELKGVVDELLKAS
jgi:hypothetical protein